MQYEGLSRFWTPLCSGVSVTFNTRARQLQGFRWCCVCTFLIRCALLSTSDFAIFGYTSLVILLTTMVRPRIIGQELRPLYENQEITVCSNTVHSLFNLVFVKMVVFSMFVLPRSS
jgi:hypothetical protein